MEKTKEEQMQEVAGLDIGKLPVGAPSDEAAEKTEEKEDDKTEDKSAEGADETSVEENKVSYSRFKNVHQRYRDAEAKALELEERLAELESQKAARIERETPTFEGRKWQLWTKLYGDTPQSREVYQTFMAEFAPPDESYIKQIAAEAYQAEARNEARRVESNEQYISDELENVSVLVGRDLTDDEEVALMLIMEENSLHDDDGTILRLYPAEQAWDLYEMQQQAGKSTRQAARNKVAGLTSSSSAGEPTPHGRADDKNFDPSWGALDKKIQQRR